MVAKPHRGNPFLRLEVERLSDIPLPGGGAVTNIATSRFQWSPEEWKMVMGVYRGEVKTDDSVIPAFQLVSDCLGDGMNGMMEHLMSMQLTSAWTTFEAMAGDLWEEAVNAHPDTLATKACENKSLPMKYFKEGFDLTKRMGTVLREYLENPFQSLSTIAKTYQDTFPDGWASQPEFWNNKDVSATSSLRNIIVHRAGIVDHQFEKNGRADPRLQGFTKGQQFLLDGELLSQLVCGLFDFSQKLISSVDSWICRN